MQDTFVALGLAEPLLRALTDLGYEVPTPIQARAVRPLLEGRDLIGEAQTGTGKTAAFALPLLQHLEPKGDVQALVLVPTRELALQVSEAFHSYARHLGGVSVVPIYGGQPIGAQLGRLRKGAQVVVGTPGRVMDHLRRGSLRLDALRRVVIDEADEMLRMGFIDDVEWILEQAPAERQIALFSATMPAEIRKIATRHLRDAVTVRIERPTLTLPTLEQRYVVVPEAKKLDALTRILEIEPVDAVIVFARTRLGVAELTEKLQGRGVAAEAIHGDMTQQLRETVVRRLKTGLVDVLVATDVAARGLDIERVTHVINHDVPNDVDAYVHRIGRTGRAGRTGIAITFVTPREQRLLKDIERHTRQKLTPTRLPSLSDLAARRVALFKDRLRAALAEDLELDLTLVHELVGEGHDVAEVAAAAVRLARGDAPLPVEVEPEVPQVAGWSRLFVGAGRRDGVRPQDIVGAIANETGLPGKAIGAIDIYDNYTFVEVPAVEMSRILEALPEVALRGRRVAVRPAVERERRR